MVHETTIAHIFKAQVEIMTKTEQKNMCSLSEDVFEQSRREDTAGQEVCVENYLSAWSAGAWQCR